MSKKMQLVNGTNQFTTKKLPEMCEVLEKGMKLKIYIDCIGHTRDMYESAAYVRALQEIYRERLVHHPDEFGHVYSLKD